MAVRPFSIRHRQAILDKKLAVKVPVRLRKRLWSEIAEYDHPRWAERNPSDNWRTESSVLTEVELTLKRIYGESELMASSPPEWEKRQVVDLQGFVLGAYPAEVLDVVEMVYAELIPGPEGNFQEAVNQVFDEERFPWRLSEGRFFQVDAQFLAVELEEKTQELLKGASVGGALEEFLAARADLTATDFKGAVVNACKAFESTLKWALGREKGNANELIKEFIACGYCDDLPEAMRVPFGDAVLKALPFLRNRLGGHGQGAEVVETPRAYAELAVHLAGALIRFAVAKSLERRPKEQQQAPAAAEDDVPF